MFGRRQLITGAAALAASRFIAAAQAAPTNRAPRLTHDPFALGVASGEPASDGLVLWTRAVGLTEDVRLGYEIASDENFRAIVRSGGIDAPAGRGGAAHLEVRGLPPGRPYFYRFHLGDAVSRVGRAATVAANPERLRLALTSCQHWEHGWFSAYRDMIEQNVDAVLQVGDYIYEKSFGSGPNVRAFGAPDPLTLDDYRARHALYRTDPDLAAAHAAMPFIVALDDHEVENDYAGVHGGVTVDPAAFLRRRTAAWQAYFEHMPLRPSAWRSGGSLQLFRRFRWGRLATVHMLDTRQYRSVQACSDEKRGGQVVRDCDAVADPGATMLGARQEAWLDDGLARERGIWSLVAQQTLFSRLVLPQGPDARWSDMWDGYEAARHRALGSLGRPTVRNAVVLGGDVHSFWLNNVLADFGDPRSKIVASEVVTSCLASRNGPAALFDGARSRNPHIRYHDNAHAGYALLDVVPERIDVDLRAVASLDEPAARCFSLERRSIEAGRPGFA
ncbi:MAG: alkaline phosphatase D family protein [Sphingopyxis solisilvae]|uniref:alkaline phosphatase D family protein n=1 Tax=Sphingopyxis solisilvae TaxID=1886788 RepID=UPI004036EC56